MMLALKPVEFARYVLEAVYRGRHRLSWARMELVHLVWRLDQKRLAGEAAVTALAAVQPDAPAVRQWAEAEQALCPEEFAHRPIAPHGNLPADAPTRALALITLAEPMAEALHETVAELEREIRWRTSKGVALHDLNERKHRAQQALLNYRRCVTPEPEPEA